MKKKKSNKSNNPVNCSVKYKMEDNIIVIDDSDDENAQKIESTINKVTTIANIQ